MLSEGKVRAAQAVSPGAQLEQALGKTGAALVQWIHGAYSDASRSQRVFHAYATPTAPVIYTTAAGTGGPLIWNPPNSGVDVSVIGVSVAESVVSTVAGSLGFTGNAGQLQAPTATTAIDAVGPGYVGGPASKVTAYRVGTPTTAGNFFLPVFGVSTGALTVTEGFVTYQDLSGLLTCPPGAWIAVAGSATLTTLVAQIGLVWEEVPRA